MSQHYTTAVMEAGCYQVVLISVVIDRQLQQCASIMVGTRTMVYYIVYHDAFDQ